MYSITRVKHEVFRAYDIRGVINQDFNENAFYTIGRAISQNLYQLGRFDIFLARDTRLTSEKLARALKYGFLDSGINVVDLGSVATPVMYYATHEHGIDSGVIVTGSHNPPDYNGIKMVLAGKSLVQSDIDLIFDLAQTANFVSAKGKSRFLNVIEDYMARIVADISMARRLKVVVDCGNAVGGEIIPKVIGSLCEVIPLFCEVDGRFPNHHPDPSVAANLVDLQNAVLQHQADIGLAFDGDADRLGVITNKGTLIWPDRLMMYYARALLKDKAGETIVYDVKCSAALKDVIEEAGGKPLMCPTGHSIVKQVMKTKKAALAGEMSGHIFFKDKWYGFDDALYSACRLLEIVSQSELSVEQQFLEIPNRINTPEIKINMQDDEKFGFMQRFCAEADFDANNIILIDGLRVEFSRGWGLIRASNTTPCLVARFEAEDKNDLICIQDLFKKELLKIDASLILPF